MAIAGAGAAVVGAATTPEGIGVPLAASGLAAARLGAALAADGARRWHGDTPPTRTAQENARPPTPPLVPPIPTPPPGGFDADRDANRGTTLATHPVPDAPRPEGLVADPPQGANIVELGGDGEPDIIEPPKQDKHIAGPNKDLGTRSEWTHPDPQSLLNIYTGKLSPRGRVQRGQLRFMEVFDTADVIVGKHQDPETGVVSDTTRATIHYSKKGAHIVPAAPRAPEKSVNSEESVR